MSLRRTNRRGFIAGAGAAALASVALGRGSDDMKHITIAKAAHKWTNPYVTDGLVAMYDGAWNAGGGKHDSSSRLVDIVGNEDDIIIPSGSLGDDFVSLSSYVSGSCSELLNIDIQIEFVFEVTGTTDYVKMFKNCDSNSRGRAISRMVLQSDGGWSYRLDSIHKYSGDDIRYNLSYDVLGLNSSKAKKCSVSTAFPKVAFNKTFKAYFNGVECDYKRGAENTLIELTDDFSIGGGINFHSLRIYNRSLTTDEIAANYAVDKERFGLT